MRKTAIDSFVITILNATGQGTSFILYATIAALFGANSETDAFFLALTIPAFFIGSAVNAITSVFIPVFTECRIQRRDEFGELLGAAILYGLTLTVLISFGIVGIIFLIQIELGKDSSTEFQQMVFIHTWFLLPTIGLQILIGLLAAAYNSEGRFWLPAGAVVIRCIASFVLLILLKPTFGGLSLSLCFTLGALVQMSIIVGFMHTLDVRPVFNFRIDPQLRSAFHSALPLVLGTAALQLNMVAVRFFATQLPAGNVSVLDYAMRISSGVMELLTSGVLLVTLVDWSHLSALGDVMQLRARLSQTIAIMMFVILPIIAVLIALREDVLTLLLQRGAFNAETVRATEGALFFALLAIPLDLIARVYVRLFLVWRDTKTLGLLSFVRLFFTALLATALVKVLDVRGIVIADALAITLITFLLKKFADRRLGGPFFDSHHAILKMLAIAVISGLIIAIMNPLLISMALWFRLLLLVISGSVVYVILSWLMRVTQLMRILQFASFFRIMVDRL